MVKSILIPSYVGFWPVREIAIDLIEPEQRIMLVQSKSSGAFPQLSEALGAVAVAYEDGEELVGSGFPVSRPELWQK